MVLELCDVSKKYRDKEALSRVSIALIPGSTGCWGPTGRESRR